MLNSRLSRPSRNPEISSKEIDALFNVKRGWSADGHLVDTLLSELYSIYIGSTHEIIWKTKAKDRNYIEMVQYSLIKYDNIRLAS